MDAAGHLDVSPRAGQPTALRIGPQREPLLPHLWGNRRLDTLGNVLADPLVTLLLFRESAHRVLRIAARPEIATVPETRALCPADESPPLSIMLPRPSAAELVETQALRRAVR